MNEKTIEFKNNLPNLTVLRLFSQDFSVVKSHLQQKLKQAPMMFIGMQMVIDISAFDKDEALVLDFSALLTFLQGEGINPVAVMSDRADFRQQFVSISGLGVLPVLQNKTERQTTSQKYTENHSEASSATDSERQVQTPIAEKTPQPTVKPTASSVPRKTFENATEQAAVGLNNQVIRHPVRSGQRIYSKGDLTVVGSISHGAEVIANGSIHVYGKLHGRAIAGANGDESACIFCQSLDAELVAIAGNYKQLEDISADYLNKQVQISLEKEKIIFYSL